MQVCEMLCLLHEIKAVVQLLMCSMAIADIGMVTIAWLLFAVAALNQSWTFGIFLCKLLTFAQPMTGDSSMWVIAIVSIDRFDHSSMLVDT